MISEVDRNLPIEQLYKTDIDWHFIDLIFSYCIQCESVSPYCYNLDAYNNDTKYLLMCVFAINILSIFYENCSTYLPILSIDLSLFYQA